MRTRYSRTLRGISAVTLAFFSWTFLSLWQIPAAIAAEKQKTAAKGQPPGNSVKREQRPEEKFEGVFETMRENVSKAGKKADRGEDDSAEREAIRGEKTEIEEFDLQLKKEFDATEQRLKAAKLPREILLRHAAFVEHYTNNVNSLKKELDDIDKAKTKTDRKAKIEKVRLHLEKARPQKKHIPLDPERLPHRQVRGKEKKPRLKKEEFERDFPRQKSRSRNIADIRLLPDLFARKPQSKPVLLAYNETASDIPFSLGVNPINPQFAFSDTSPIILAQQTADLPSPEDLASTPEIQADSPLIRAKAQELGCAPARLYAWTRNEIFFTPTYGSIQGAEMCLQTKECNAFDTNSLLAALFRSCNIPARLNIGTIELPIEKVMNWAGGFSDPTAALNYLASGGIPVTGLRSGGKIYAARLETAWVSAFVDYIPSFGAVQRQSNTWIPLDASFKQFSYSDGVDFSTVVPFDGQALANQIKATATINTQEGYVTNVSTTLVQSAQSEYEVRLNAYVAQNLPNATPGDILGKKEIIKKTQPILPASLPYKVVVAGTETSAIPDQLRHKITVQLVDADTLNTAITYTTSLPQLAGKRFTVSYDPATAADQATINSYVEKYATSIPAYLVQFKPSLRIEGTIVATGAAIGMGNAQNLTISIVSPGSTEMVTHNLLAGDYTAVGINPSKISLDVLQNRINKNDFSEHVGEMLHQTALSYWAEADAFNNVIAKTLRVNNLRHPSELTAAAKVTVSYVWGVPNSATYNRRNIDVKLDNQSVITRSTDKTKEFYYMQQSGTNSSFLEGAIMDQLFGGNIGDSISAVTALKTANDQGVPIYRIDASNIAAVLPQLQVADAIKNEISNAINAGLTVQIPQTNIAQNGWTGVGYIVFNTIDGSGAYRISGGLNGSDNKTDIRSVVPFAQIPLTGKASLVAGTFASNGNLKLQVKEVSGVYILLGVALAPEALAGGGVLATITLIAAFFALVKTLVDTYKPSPRWLPFRHYTSLEYLEAILQTNFLKPSGDGSFGPGVYVTNTVMLDPQIPGNSEIIAQKLGISDVNKTQTYIDIAVDPGQVLVVPGAPFGYPDEYTLSMPPLFDLTPIPLDGIHAKRIDNGPLPLNP